MVDERWNQQLHHRNPTIYHINHSRNEQSTIMSEVPPASHLRQNLLDFLMVHRWDNLECRGCRRFETREKQASHGYHELVTEVSNAFIDRFCLHGTSDAPNVTEIPECMHKRALCDIHHQVCLDFVCGPGGNTLQDRCVKSFTPGKFSGWTSTSTETALSQDHGDEKPFSSHKYTDEAGQQLSDDVDGDSDDELEDDMIEDSGANSGDNEDDVPLSVDALDVVEYDREEVIQKDQVSQRRKGYIVDENDVRTLLSVPDLDGRNGSMSDSTQGDTKINADCTTPKRTGEHSSSSPFTPKDHPLFVQRSYDTHSARRSLFTDQFQLSPNHRTLRTVTTLSADPTYDEDVELNEKAVRRLIMDSPDPKGDSPAYEKAGYVYAFGDNELSLIKFGRTTDLKARKAYIERVCGFVKGISLVAAVKVKACKRLEDIIHQDLAPHRWFFDCGCGQFKRQKGFTRHQEWFQIDNHTASSTLQLWADFVERQPWNRKLSHRRGTYLKRKWHDKMLASSRIEPSESHESHNDRVKRWREFLDIPSPEVKLEVQVKGGIYTPRLTMRSTVQNGNDVTGHTESYKPDYTPSKPPKPATQDTAEADKSAKSNLSFAESLKRSSSSNKLSDLAREQNLNSTARESTFSLPDRTKDGKSTPTDTAVTTTSSLKAKIASNGPAVPQSGQRPSPVFHSIREAQQNTDYTPSKPPRSAAEDIAEADKSIQSNSLFSKPPKRSLASCEPIDRAHESDSRSTGYTFTFGLPHCIKDGGSDLNDTAAITTSSLQAKSSSNDTNVPPAGKRSSPFYAGAYNAQQNTGGPLEKPQHEAPSAAKGLPSDLGFAAAPIFPKKSIDRAPSSNAPTSPDWRSQPGDNPEPSATLGHTEGIKQSNDGVIPATRGNPGETRRPHIEVRPSDAVFSPSQKIPNNATVLSASPIAQSMTELARCLLAKEVRPLPARAISADIWQFRWPLACSIAFALHSPHIPAGLSFLMWSIFLPFFVAELRGWNVAN